MFSVQVPEAGDPVASVVHGVVAVTATDQVERRLLAHQRTDLTPAAPAVPLPAEIEARDLSILGGAPSVEERAETEHEAPEAKPKASAAAPEATPVELLQQAREWRSQGRFGDAVRAYRRLEAAHPRSPEAHAALVSLGELELTKLGDAAAARRSFDTYLASGGGALAQEALYGRIRALKALGDRAVEKDAIVAFLAAYPASVQATPLRARLSELTAPTR
jgi:hypothetical protein